jgi:hypothetical protein
MPETIYNANLLLTPSLKLSSFISNNTPGNVAVCLSGGGSRAMVAGMGQLLALETVRNGNASLLSQSMMLTSVSGGSWAAVPFTFLTSGTTDEAFLGGPYTAPASLTATGITTLPEGCVASNITADFSIEFLAALAFVLHHFDGIPDNMLWQVMIGTHLLKPYELFQQTDGLPNTYFAYDQAGFDAIQKENSGNPLATETPNVVAQVSGQSRPFFLCMTAMSVADNTELVPVQSTPFFTGIVSSPENVTDVDGRLVGGGGVTSFAFNSAPTSLNGTAVSVKQSQQWSLVDIVGSSSAAYGELLIEALKDFTAHPPLLAAALSSNRDSILQHVAQLGLDIDRAANIIDSAVATVVSGDIATLEADFSFDPAVIVPSYQYWSPVNSTAGETVNASFFTDGGNLDNTGVASTLAYSEIENVIAFINSETALTKDSKLNIIIVDRMIPPLFGYQPYDETNGYVLYGQTPLSKENALNAHNQIFDSSDFFPLLNGLWNASGAGKYQNSPIFKQTLTTKANSWFGVPGNTTVNVLWVYLENTMSWSKQLQKDVLQTESELVTKKKFPHYNTFTAIELDPQEINLLANLAAWTVMNNEAIFQSMYT